MKLPSHLTQPAYNMTDVRLGYVRGTSAFITADERLRGRECWLRALAAAG